MSYDHLEGKRVHVCCLASDQCGWDPCVIEAEYDLLDVAHDGEARALRHMCIDCGNSMDHDIEWYIQDEPAGGEAANDTSGGG